MAANAKTTPEQLLWKGRRAAQACEISERQLWAQTQPRGPIPCVRIGNSVRYSPEALQRFFESQQQEGTAERVSMVHNDAELSVVDIVRLHRSGDSVAVIAEKLHLPVPTVQHALDHGRLPELQPQWSQSE